MFRTGILAGSFAVFAIVFAMVLTDPISAQDDQQRDRERVRSAEDVKEFTGIVVDLYHYLNRSEYTLGEHDDSDVAGKHNGGPVALLTSKEGMIRTSRELRVIVFASREDANRLRSRANGMVGKHVRIVGYEASRDGIVAVTAREIEPYHAGEERRE